MNSSLLSSFNKIKRISLFNNLTESELKQVLRNAKIQNYKKGKTLFLREEKSVNLLIVVSGIVKIFISDAEGNDTVLQIADFGTSLNNIFSNIFPNTAEVAKDSSILSIPLSDVKEFTAKNLNFTTNVLADFATKNDQLLTQLTQLKLTNSKQKLGQFLLGMAFKQTGNKEKNIELECDKSIIASYLGMKSETFSRTLQKLKDDGEIAVKKNQITLLQDNSLCDYCDSKIAAKCKNHKSSFCQDTHF